LRNHVGLVLGAGGIFGVWKRHAFSLRREERRTAPDYPVVGRRQWCCFVGWRRRRCRKSEYRAAASGRTIDLR
jgi:hypothetical protein